MSAKRLTLNELVKTIKLYFDSGENKTEVARQLGINVGTIYSRLKTARAKKLIERHRQDPTYLDNLVVDLEGTLIDQYQTIAQLERQVETLQQFRRQHVADFYDNIIRFGLVSDTHIGSLYAQQDNLEGAYDVFAKEGIETVYHCGDLLDGEKMYRGQEYEIFRHGCDAQVEECIDNYPRREGVSTRFITGNHDMSFWKRAGVNVGPKIALHRDDMFFLGVEESDIHYACGENDVTVRLAHPGKGTAYALSYQIQKYIESLTGGVKPHVLCVGHYHKAEVIPQYRNVYAVQAGCLERQTPFMRNRNIAAHEGFWIIEFSVNEPKKVSRFKAEWFSYFE